MTGNVLDDVTLGNNPANLALRVKYDSRPYLVPGQEIADFFKAGISIRGNDFTPLACKNFAN
jgi:hypothetical protein